MPFIPVAQVNWINLLSAITFWRLGLFDTYLRCVNTCNNVYCMHKTEYILEGSFNCCLNFAWHYNSNYWIGILSMVFWSPSDSIFTPYPWHIEHPIHGILKPTHGMLTPYPWYIELPIHGILIPLPIVFWPPIHGSMTHLSMVFWPFYPWYFDLSINCVLTSRPMVYRPRTHAILTHLSMVFWSLYQ